HVTRSTSALGSLPFLPVSGSVSGFGASPLGHFTSVYRESPVVVENARNSLPAADSESKSMISRCRSSMLGDFRAARVNAKVEAGGGVVIGSKPRFRRTHARSIII